MPTYSIKIVCTKLVLHFYFVLPPLLLFIIIISWKAIDQLFGSREGGCKCRWWGEQIHVRGFAYMENAKWYTTTESQRQANVYVCNLETFFFILLTRKSNSIRRSPWFLWYRLWWYSSNEIQFCLEFYQLESCGGLLDNCCSSAISIHIVALSGQTFEEL